MPNFCKRPAEFPDAVSSYYYAFRQSRYFEINAWFLENYPNIAESWLWGISQAVTSLSKFPERCTISSESEAFDVIVRQLIYSKKPRTYRILFSIQDEKVYVLHVRSTKQQSLLDE